MFWGVTLQDAYHCKDQKALVLICTHHYFWFIKRTQLYGKLNDHWHTFPEGTITPVLLDRDLNSLSKTIGWFKDHQEMVTALKHPELAELAETKI